MSSDDRDQRDPLQSLSGVGSEPDHRHSKSRPTTHDPTTSERKPARSRKSKITSESMKRSDNSNRMPESIKRTLSITFIFPPSLRAETA